SMPAPTDIDKYMDFNSVFAKYQSFSLPFYKRAWFKWGIAVVVVAAGVSLAVAALSNDKVSNTETKKEAPVVEATNMPEESPCINPPVDGGEKPFRSYVISGTRDTVIITDKGSVLRVPADIAGNGAYELRIREFSKNMEVFLSGIPMDYDSAGQKYAFQSAGMMEILAFRNNEMVKMEAGKSIKIILKGENPNKDFNVYCLDTVGKKWNYEGKDVVRAEHLSYPQSVVNQNATTEVEELTTTQLKNEMEACRKTMRHQVHVIDSLNTRKPIAPCLADTSAYFFDLKFSETKFPQMKPFKKAHFQVLEECTFFNSSFYNSKWTSISVSEKIPGQKYMIHVERKKENKKEKFDIPVKPVYVGKAYDSAYTAFTKSFKKYEAILEQEDKKFKENELKIKQYEARIKNASNNNVNNDNGIITVNTPANLTAQKMGPEYSVTRIFYANKFGVWNCDKPWPYKKNEEVMVVARDISGSLLKEGKLYVCDLTKKAMFTYNERERVKIGMEKGSSYMVWIIDADQQLHYASADFRTTALPESKKVILEMRTLAQIPTDPIKLQRILGI
ncbi:MAG: hypothetical protein ACHQF2_04480, partial [Flavobacteriales bacterium]